MRNNLILSFFLKTLDIKTDQSPNDILNIPKLKAKHKRLFKKLVSLKAKNQINEFKGIILFFIKH